MRNTGTHKTRMKKPEGKRLLEKPNVKRRIILKQTS
jgi:hypothetical protein